LLAGQIHHNLCHLDTAISNYEKCTKLIGEKLAK
jgi:hypothetical protein